MTSLFKDFFHSEKSAGFILIAATAVSLLIANLGNSDAYVHFWHRNLDLSFAGLDLNYSIEHWVNDGLMTVFFLLIGLEIERELYKGELSSFKNAILPIVAAIGGMVVPVVIYFAFNYGTDTADGFGIPMATDIAFALGILSLAGKSVPVALKIFLTALAIIDDLGAIAVIAIFYSGEISLLFLAGALLTFVLLFIAGKNHIYNKWFFIAGGLVMWYCMLKAGIHPSIAGVLLAFAIPFHQVDRKNPSYQLQHALHIPVAFVILPLFALANTAFHFPPDFTGDLLTPASLGIMAGLLAGKLGGIFLFSFAAVKARLAALPEDTGWKHIAGVGLLGGIGFTMSMFIANLAFAEQGQVVAAKMSILLASFVAAVAGLVVLTGRKMNTE